MGRVCAAKAGKPVLKHERDLFGFNVALAAEAAAARVTVQIEVMTVSAVMAVRHEFAAARRRLGVRS